MAGRIDEAEALATANVELGMQIGAPDAFAMFGAQLFMIGTFGGRHAEMAPLVEQVAKDNPEVVSFRIGYGIACAGTGREDVGHEILREGMASGFRDLPVDIFWTTNVIAYSILAIELDQAEAAAQLLPMIEPFANEVSWNGITSQGPIAAYVGKLASLIGRHDQAEDHLRVALEIADAFGWRYHRATTLLALAEVRHRQLGRLDAEGQAWLSEASERCRTLGFRFWIPRIDALADAQPGAAHRH
jgi:tetratricopeptide (TPR) repeat protein